MFAGVKGFGPQRELRLNGLSLLLFSGVWVDASLGEKVHNLSRDLLQSFLRKQEGVVLELLEGNELDDVSTHVLFVLLGIQRVDVCVKNLHRAEVCVAHSDDHDRERKVCASHDLVNCLGHVADDSVGNYQQDLVVLIVLRNFHSFGPSTHR